LVNSNSKIQEVCRLCFCYSLKFISFLALFTGLGMKQFHQVVSCCSRDDICNALTRLYIIPIHLFAMIFISFLAPPFEFFRFTILICISS
jgi:hypothetical protein